MNTALMDSNDYSQRFDLIVQEAASIGAIVGLVRTGALKPYLKKNEAFRKFGRARVEGWIKSGIITIRKDGNHSAAWRINRLEIEAVASAEKICQWL